MATMVLLLPLVLLTLPSHSTADFGPHQDGRGYGGRINTSALSLRLANGTRCSGRVEIYYNGEWGTVCDDLFDMTDAEVVCRQIGCGRPIACHIGAYFGQGRGPIVMDDTNCSGSETYLWNCSHRGLGRHNCGHSEDVGVTCRDQQPRISTTSGRPYSTTTTSDKSTEMSTENLTTSGPTLSSSEPLYPTQNPTSTSYEPSYTTSAPSEPSTTTQNPTSTPSEPSYTTSAPSEPSTTTQNPTSTPSDITGMCGGILTEPFGRITSPLYPSYYPLNINCTWEIRTAQNTVIELNFPTVNLESYQNCTYDSICIFDGPPGPSPVLGRICQSRIRSFRSSSNIISIVFISDGSIQNTGFEAYYTTVPATNRMTEKCGGISTDLQGAIYSYRADFLDSDNCVWHINVDSRYKIHLSFSSFNMIDSRSCHSYSLSVYDGTPRASPFLGQLCETSARSFVSSANSLSIVYSKLHDDTDLGLTFYATYNAVFQDNTNVTLSCHSDYMEAEISLQYLESLGYSSSNIFLKDPECRPRILGDRLEFHIPYQRCLTSKQVLNDTITYINTLFTYSMDPVVIYRKKLNLTLRCQMYQDTIVDSVYEADDIMDNSLVQYGLYLANLTFFTTPDFIYPVYLYPYYVKLNQNLYLQATLDTTDPDLVLFVDTCVASPDHFHHSLNVFYLIRNGCSRLSDYRTYYSPSQSTLRFGFNAFSFLSRFSSVYIQCQLVVCNRFDRWSRCNQGCMPRHKRAVESKQEKIHAVVGPITLLNS